MRAFYQVLLPDAKACSQDSALEGRAFTLVELLVVVAIIGILAASLFPVLSKSKASAHATACQNHLHQMGIALQMYVHEHENKYPLWRGHDDPSLNQVVGNENTGFWWAKLSPYYALSWTNRNYHCPGYKGSIQGSIVMPGSWSHPTGSYAYNADGVQFDGQFTHYFADLGLGGMSLDKSSPYPISKVVSQDDIVAPSEMFSIGESRWKAGQFVNGGGSGKDFMQCVMFSFNRGVAAFDPSRHGNTYNQAFCDGHVATMNPWILFNPTNTAAMWNYDHQPHPEFWFQ